MITEHSSKFLKKSYIQVRVGKLYNASLTQGRVSCVRVMGNPHVQPVRPAVTTVHAVRDYRYQSHWQDKCSVRPAVTTVLTVWDYRYQPHARVQTVQTVQFVQPPDVVARFLPRFFRYHPRRGH